MPNLQVSIANQIATSAAQTTLSLQGLITTMKASGMADSAIKQTLMNDLNSGGPLFGAFKNNIKNTVRNSVELSSNASANGQFVKAGVKMFQWVTLKGSKVCPDCEGRHGLEGTNEYFDTIGREGSGFSVCQQHCRCKILPVGYKDENLDKPLVKGKAVTKSVGKIGDYFTNNKMAGLKPEYQDAISGAALKLKNKGYINQKIKTIQFNENTGKEWGRMSKSGTLSLRKSFFDKHLNNDQTGIFNKQKVKKIQDAESFINTLKTRKGVFGAEESIQDALNRITILKSTKRFSTADDVVGLARIESVTIHELGHAVDFANEFTDGEVTNAGSLFGKHLKANRVKEIDIKTVSQYAAVNQKELFAETFTLYNTGKKSQIPKNLLKAFESTLNEVFIE